jgi:putative peptide maturation dehydrogenase
MRLRRCAHLVIEPRERLSFDLSLLAGGASGVRHVVDLVAIVPHAPAVEVELSADEAALALALSSADWSTEDELAQLHAPALLASLRTKDVLVAEGSDADRRDRVVRAAHWRPLAAAAHYASRWQGVDVEQAGRDLAENTRSALVDHLGEAPPVVRERCRPDERVSLERQVPAALDALLDRRVTCRNFDRTRALSLAQFSSVLYRTYGARAVDEYAPGVHLLKKGVPSAGGLHPTEAYLLVQRVDGVAPGLYHYHPVDHALEPLRLVDAEEAAALARRFVAAQAWFVDAHVMVVPTSRFARTFWKYRRHPKAHRALILDVGHLSQTMYLAATELGLGAFITAAVNEVDIEQAFDLDPLEEGPLAVTGFGVRGAERNEVEFDPLNTVWPSS